MAARRAAMVARSTASAARAALELIDASIRKDMMRER
jgi:hypothetical protein